MSDDQVQRTLNAVWRLESAKIIATVARIVGDVGLAEDLAQDAMVTALEKWPEIGIPDNPGAWLVTAAKRRAIDQVRRRTLLSRKHAQIGAELAELEAQAPDFDSALDDDVGDDMLRLLFVACHPILAAESQVALTLRLLGGLTTDEIARAFLVPEATLAQRIVRAKKTLAEAKVVFEMPPKDQRDERLASVLSVIYLIFNEGYSATTGDDWMRPELCHDALRLGRILAELVPKEAEVHGLVALMEIQASRARARVAADGSPILLLEQNRGRWDQILIHRGQTALERAKQQAGEAGPYQLQAEIAAFHGRAKTAEETDWEGIAKVYARLAKVTPSPIVELNRAVAIGMARGPAAGLAHVDKIRHDKALKYYHLLPAVRADLLQKLGRPAEARTEYLRAAELTQNSRERDLLTRRAAAL